MGSNSVELEQPIRFGEGYEVDLRPRRLRRGSHVLKLERIPLEILVLLLEHRDEIVTREQIVSRVWGQGAFLDTDNSIRGAIRKLRQALRDDAETPRYIQTITGQGYRFIAPVTNPKDGSVAEAPEREVSNGDRNFASEMDDWLHARRLRLVEQDQDRSEEAVAHAEATHRQGNRSARKWRLVAVIASLAMASVVALLAVRAWRPASRSPLTAPRKTVLLSCHLRT